MLKILWTWYFSNNCNLFHFKIHLQKLELILNSHYYCDIFQLQNSGIQFEKHEEEGIDPNAFAELMLVSGLVLMDNVKWLSFHSGYDFGYLVKLNYYLHLNMAICAET